MIIFSLIIIIGIIIAIIIVSVGNVNKFEEIQKNAPGITKEEYKGKEGEKETAIWLNKIEGNKQIINNITFNDNGKTRQIDHIAITEAGVFVIETKNFSGKIYGRENSKEWKQYLGKQSFSFANPIHQNFGHTEIVKSILHGKIEKICSVIVFTRRGKLKIEETKTKVMYVDEIKDYIENQTKVINDTQIQEIYSILMESRVTNQEYIENHNYNVKCYVQGKQEKVQQGICPKCYGKLVKRKGKNGEFYGCSNFPKCRYTIKIN